MPALPLFFQVTAQYSNAVLVAALPHVSDFATKLELPISLPVTPAQVWEFKCDPRQGNPGGVITLTNGGQFWFMDGYISKFRSPRSYFSLQDPNRIPEFYGPVNIKKDEAVKIARDTINKLGYSKVLPAINSEPEVTLPEKIGTNFVARYDVKWITSPPSLERAYVEVEVNASNKRVQMLSIFSPRIPREELKIDERILALNKPIKQQVTQQAPPVVGGAERSVFLMSILPGVSDFAKRLQIPLPTLTTNDIDMEHTKCWVQDGKTFANVRLKQGQTFTYKNGYVSGYYASDSSQIPDNKKDLHKFVGKVKVSEKKAVKLARKTIKQLGWDNVLQSDMRPEIAYPMPVGRFTLETGPEGTNIYARYFVCWTPPDDKGNGSMSSSVEIDATTGGVKSVYANHPKLWRDTSKTDPHHEK